MIKNPEIPRLAVFPLTAKINSEDHLEIGGCDTLALAKEFGTPLYIFDEADLRARCREFKTEFNKYYPGTIVSYSPKAFTAKAMLKLAQEEGLHLDVVSGGEIGYARAIGFPMDKVHFPGNNKSAEELKLAVRLGIGHIVVDNLPELNALIKIAGKKKVNILLRLNPGIDPHTHKYNRTGLIDSKFGLPRYDWDEAVAAALSAPNLNVDGLHFHVGSGLFEVEPFTKTIDVVLEYAAEIKKKNNFTANLLSIGGGFGAQYLPDAVPPPVGTFAQAISGEIKNQCRKLNLKLPRLMIEPGRKVVAQACAALYTVGVIKAIPGIRTYVSVDGGMSDNIRQPMYGDWARQEALLANRASAENTEKVTISGKLCESGDILIKEIMLPSA